MALATSLLLTRCKIEQLKENTRLSILKNTSEQLKYRLSILKDIFELLKEKYKLNVLLPTSIKIRNT